MAWDVGACVSTGLERGLFVTANLVHPVLSPDSSVQRVHWPRPLGTGTGSGVQVMRQIDVLQMARLWAASLPHRGAWLQRCVVWDTIDASVVVAML